MTSAGPSTASPPPQATSSSQPGSAGTPAVVGSQHTSVPQQPRSYAHATRHSVSSAPLVVGALQHGKADSVNLPQKTAANMAAPPVVHGGNASGPVGPVHEHSRKPSVTISASGSSGQMPNGAPAAPAARHNISFGAMNPGGDSPAIANSNPYHHPASSLSAAQDNPRINSPAASPSPIPQPAASGGRPPDRPQAQNNGLSFGSMPEGAVGSHVPSPGPGMQGQNAHFRRASSQSQHGDMQMSPGVGRGGYMNGPPRGGRGYNPGYGGAPPYSPGPAYRGMHTPTRNGPGMPHHLQNQMGPHQNSPHGPARSPAPMGSSQPGTPTMSHMQMHGQPAYPSYPGYAQQLPGHPGHFQSQPDFQPYHNYYGQPYQVHPGYMQAPPQTPRNAGYKGQPPVAHQQYAHPPYNQPPSQNMSRTSSQMSERPASSVGSAHPQPSSTPANNQISHGHSQSTSAASQNSNFKIPPRSKGIVIKNSEGEILKFDKNDKKSSPAPTTATPSNAPSPAPAVASSTPPPPPPQQPAIAVSHTHTRSESKSTKSAAEIRQEFMNNVKKEQEKDNPTLKEEAVSEDKAKEQPASVETKEPSATKSPEKSSEPSEPSEPSTGSTAEVTDKAAVASSAQVPSTQSKEAAEKQEDAARGASDDAVDKAQESEEAKKKREDEEFERMVAEMEAREREETEKEQAFQQKRKKELEEKAAREKEEAALADEKMKQAEREAEAREEERAREKPKEEENAEDAENQRLFRSLKKSNLGPGAEEAQPSDSQASTPPASETSRDRESMPPPARANKSAGISRPKPPAALKLETSKPVDPAQPTPGMRSLRSARMLQLQSESIVYPDGIQSPNPALNQSGRRGGRLYDTGFLMQFQEAFKEKPSLDWDQKVKETLGDSNDAAPKSARPAGPNTPGGRGGRPPAPFPSANPMGGIGNFGRRDRPGPGGVMFDPSKSMSNPIGQFSNNRPGFIPGPTRAASGQNSHHMNHSQRGSNNRGSKTGSKMTLKQQEQMNNKMPLTAGADLKPLEASGSGWKPMSIGRPPVVSNESSTHMAPDMVQRKVKANLNKMTPERFEKIAGQIMQIAAQSKDESDGRTLRQVIALTFEKACDEAHWASMYAQFCQHMLQEMSQDIKDENVRDKMGTPVVGGALFRKYLLNRCQEEFERGWVVNLPGEPGQNDEAAMLSDEYYKAAAAKRKGLGLVQFIGELYKLRMLSIKIMHQCVTKLLDFEGDPDETAIESLVKLLRTIGHTMDNEQGGQPLINMYFERIDKIMKEDKLISRLHFALLDVIDLRRNEWRDKDSQKGPKTIQEIHEEALVAQQKAEAERQRQNQRGGGRMPSGRQDARNFSNPPPPQDYARNTLGSDDLRKLNQKRESRGAGLGPVKSLGPSTMLGSRSSSGRQGLGPPTGLMSRSESQAGSSPGGSGMHSRTASIKADPKKDDEPKTNVNAFSALASMDGDPTEASSPPLTKSQPAADAKKPE